MGLNKNELTFLVVLCLFASAFFIAFFPENSFYPDQEQYLVLGEEILHGGYSLGVFHRGPVLPFFVSVLYLIGFSAFGVLFVLPLLMMNASLFTVFVFGKKILDNGYIPSLVLLSFPYFWRWGVHLFTETPLLIFSSLSLLFFYLGTEKDSRHFILSGIFLAIAFLTKVHAIILLIIFIAYLLWRRKLFLLKNKFFLTGVILFVLISSSVSYFVYLLSGTFALEHIFFNRPYVNFMFYLLNFGIIPLTLFTLIGLFVCAKRRRKEDIFILLGFLIIFIIFQVMNYKEMRFMFIIFPLYALITTIGFDKAKEFSKKGAYIVLASFLVLTMAYSAWLLSFDSNNHVARIPLAKYLENTDPEVVIASEVSPYFLGLFHKKVIEFPGTYFQENGLHSKIDEWVKENNIDFVVLSIYEEWKREPEPDTFYPTVWGISFPLKYEYSGIRLPEYFDFRSELYDFFEKNKTLYKNVYEQYIDSKRIFIVYEVMYD